MRNRFGWSPWTTLVLAALGAVPLSAQQSAIMVRVTDGATQRPLPSVQVTVAGGGAQVGGLTNQAGQVRVAVQPGTYTVRFDLIGYIADPVTGVQVAAGQTTDVTASMTETALNLNEFVVTVGKKLEKKTDAPATVAVISEQTIEERPVASPTQHLFGQPGVDIIQQGMQSTNVVVRGFNNIFSGALHALTDHRIAGIPSLRVNLLHFIPSNDDDLARMEVVLGPGSALYGPNTANGVVHMITKSPLAEQGSTAALAVGLRETFKAQFRTAHLVNEDVGIKVSGQYLRGDDWEFDDPEEAEARARAPLIEQGLIIQGFPRDEIDLALSRLGVRDNQIERFSGELRGDVRVSDQGTLVLQAGMTQASGVELTGIGAGQTDDWRYAYYQARFSLDRLFAQAYLNTSDAADSYLVRIGAPLVDNSKLFVAQLQHGYGFGEMADGSYRQDFTYGADLFLTRPQTEGKINGKYEDEDNVDEFGVYVQSETALTDRLDLIAAARVDKSSILDDPVFSPRAALVFEVAENQSVRATYNRAFSTPTTLNLFLDINAGLAPGLEGLGFFGRAMGTGTGEGLVFQNADGTLRGIRTPAAPGVLLDQSQSGVLYQFALQVLVAQGVITPAQAQQLAMIPMDGISYNLFKPPFNPARDVVPLEAGAIPSAPPLRESITETIELGYQGVLANRVSLAADVWYTKKENFVSPLVTLTPLLLLNGQEVAGRLIANGVDPATAAAVAGGVAQIPTGVVSSDQVETNTADLVQSYVNFGSVDYTGFDLAVKAFLTDRFTLEANTSWVSDDFFIVRDDEEIDIDEAGTVDFSEILGLNAPDWKGSVALGFRDPELGFTAEGRVRMTSAFPVNSADFVGVACIPGFEAGVGQIENCVDSHQLVDLLLGYRIPDTGAEVQLNITNLFDSHYRNFVAVPNIGRFAMLQVKYQF